MTADWQKAGDENPLYACKLQGSPGKSVDTSAGGPTLSAWCTPGRKNATAGGVKRPDSCNPLGQSAAKLPRVSPTVVDVSDDDDDFVGGVPGAGRSTTIIKRGASLKG